MPYAQVCLADLQTHVVSNVSTCIQVATVQGLGSGQNRCQVLSIPHSVGLPLKAIPLHNGTKEGNQNIEHCLVQSSNSFMPASL